MATTSHVIVCPSDFTEGHLWRNIAYMDRIHAAVMRCSNVRMTKVPSPTMRQWPPQCPLSRKQDGCRATLLHEEDLCHTLAMGSATTRPEAIVTSVKWRMQHSLEEHLLSLLPGTTMGSRDVGSRGKATMEKDLGASYNLYFSQINDVICYWWN